MLDDLGDEDRKRYIHHYNFPRLQRGRSAAHAVAGPPGDRPRRVGRTGAAAGACPPEEEFPYTIRLVSEVLESNGSTLHGAASAAARWR